MLGGNHVGVMVVIIYQFRERQLLHLLGQHPSLRSIRLHLDGEAEFINGLVDVSFGPPGDWRKSRAG